MPRRGSHGLLLLAWDDLPQIAQIYTDGLGAKYSPTDCTEFTEPSAGDGLPQISQICTDGLGAEDSPTDCTDAISGGALVSARLCRLPEQEVHQPSKQ